MHKSHELSKNWYQEFYLWVVLAPLMVVLLASLVFVYIAFSQSDDLVVDNYYREGKMLAQDFTADEYAHSIGLKGELHLTPNRVEVLLNQDDVDHKLLLLISHPANANLDLLLTMKRAKEGLYVAALEVPLPGRWYIRLTAFNGEQERWRLHGEADFSDNNKVMLN